MGSHNHNATDILPLAYGQNLDLSSLKGTCSSDLGAHKS